MAWKKYFKKATPNQDGVFSPLSRRGGRSTGEDAVGVNSYPNLIQESYLGCPNRIERYQNFESMDQDSEVNSALDILAEFSTQSNEQDNMCFNVKFKEPPTETESKIIKKQLQSWYYLNEFNKRAFRLFRNVIKYGDQIFLRDPETFKLFYVEMDNVIKVIVNESKGKKPEQYIIRNMAPNFENLTATQVTANNLYNVVPSGPGFNAAGSGYNAPNSPYSSSSRFTKGLNEHAINAEHILHLSLTEGLDPNWPFGNSILELIFKVYKQKELLEDSIIIYRVQRAPERRVFKIDVGDMPQHLAMAFIEKVKNEMHQRRIPGRSDGGNFQDSTYFSMAPNADFFFPITSSGRGSSVEQLAGGCLKMDTKVPLLDGRTLSLIELTEEFQEGKENWVYSCNPETGEVVPGIISWAGVTHESAQVMKITLDNEEEIICTLDHKFPILEKGFVEAKDLSIGERFIPFNIQNREILKTRKKQYTQVYQNNTKKWEFVHRMIAHCLALENFVFDEQYKNSKKDVIHHKNFNRFDNSPSNLVRMAFKDHTDFHSYYGFSKDSQVLGTIAAKEKMEFIKINYPEKYKKLMKEKGKRHKEFWASLNIEERQQYIDIKKIGLQNYFKNLTDKERNIRIEEMMPTINSLIKASKDKLEKMNTDEDYYNWVCEHQQKGWDKFKKTPEAKIRGKKIGNDNRLRFSRPGYTENVFKNQRVKVDKQTLDYVQSLVLQKNKIKIVEAIKLFNDTDEYLNYYLNLNKETCCANWNNDRLTGSQLRNALKIRGYKNWKQFRDEVRLYNHAIVSIEYLSEPIQVGTLTIDKDEKYHNYHTFALASGIFTKNSNLNEIDDLKYFNNKMMRGLRIPSSYLPTGQDDSPSTINDGRVGTALIQEYRFNQYCERLQKLVCDPLDLEFKAYLKWSGINIDSSMFQLTFNPPQNFAHYRQAELDSSKISTFTQLEGYQYFSKRFLMERYLGMTSEEINENQKLWREENVSPDQIESEPSDLRNLGITAGGIDSDLQNFGGEEGMGEEMPEGGEEAAPGEGTPEGANTPVAAQGPAPTSSGA